MFDELNNQTITILRIWLDGSFLIKQTFYAFYYFFTYYLTNNKFLWNCWRLLSNGFLWLEKNIWRELQSVCRKGIKIFCKKLFIIYNIFSYIWQKIGINLNIIHYFALKAGSLLLLLCHNNNLFCAVHNHFKATTSSINVFLYWMWKKVFVFWCLVFLMMIIC